MTQQRHGHYDSYCLVSTGSTVSSAEKPTTMNKNRDATRELRHNIAWKYTFRKEWKGQETKRLSKKKMISTTPCRKDIPFDLESWMASLCNRIAKRCKATKVKQLGRQSVEPKMTKLQSYCINVLKESKWIAIPRDKQPGFCIMDKACLANNIQSEMKEPRYKSFIPLNIKWSELCDQYRRIVKKMY